VASFAALSKSPEPRTRDNSEHTSKWVEAYRFQDEVVFETNLAEGVTAKCSDAFVNQVHAKRAFEFGDRVEVLTCKLLCENLMLGSCLLRALGHRVNGQSA
jgi:hypothetical protein